MRGPAETKRPKGRARPHLWVKDDVHQRRHAVVQRRGDRARQRGMQLRQRGGAQAVAPERAHHQVVPACGVGVGWGAAPKRSHHQVVQPSEAMRQARRCNLPARCVCALLGQRCLTCTPRMCCNAHRIRAALRTAHVLQCAPHMCCNAHTTCAALRTTALRTRRVLHCALHVPQPTVRAAQRPWGGDPT